NIFSPAVESLCSQQQRCGQERGKHLCPEYGWHRARFVDYRFFPADAFWFTCDNQNLRSGEPAPGSTFSVPHGSAEYAQKALDERSGIRPKPYSLWEIWKMGHEAGNRYIRVLQFWVERRSHPVPERRRSGWINLSR